jgi:hypothetical protein
MKKLSADTGLAVYGVIKVYPATDTLFFPRQVELFRHKK